MWDKYWQTWSWFDTCSELMIEFLKLGFYWSGCCDWWVQLVWLQQEWGLTCPLLSRLLFFAKWPVHPWFFTACYTYLLRIKWINEAGQMQTWKLHLQGQVTTHITYSFITLCSPHQSIWVFVCLFFGLKYKWHYSWQKICLSLLNLFQLT